MRKEARRLSEFSHMVCSTSHIALERREAIRRVV